ncbi:hypothetical protein [Lentibacter sp. XHP0401]|jgi:hypothetical protein|uniref:hypothetical protein n=1 Tax=Lentibacter sp. XHP0401 TaxID=2984334 RepID=UPI0021E6E1D3|nr:hypothetical protein [Lentibacter sp. XHP0401]MCV2894487.1 hypothetical protein [Lentibacter sp. XHP0401]
MLIITVIFGSVVGLAAALISYFVLGLGLLGAFALYMMCSITPVLISVALVATQTVVERESREGLTTR